MNDPFSVLQGKIGDALKNLKPPPAALVLDAAQSLNPQSVVNALAMQGLAVVRNAVPQKEMTAIAAQVESQLSLHMERVNREQSKDYGDIVVNFELGQFKNFPAMAACPKPLFNMRHGRNSGVADAGFIDLFRPDVLFPELAPYRAMLESGLPAQVASRFAALKYSPTSCNLYINKGVSNPRKFHIDAELHQIKAFLYLTDVLALDDGPYCYVPGSHQETQIKNLNKLYNAAAGRPWTDMSLVDPSSAVACLAPAGTLILSMQSGLHCGYPQSPTGKRLMLVELFEPGA